MQVALTLGLFIVIYLFSYILLKRNDKKGASGKKNLALTVSVVLMGVFAGFIFGYTN